MTPSPTAWAITATKNARNSCGTSVKASVRPPWPESDELATPAPAVIMSGRKIAAMM